MATPARYYSSVAQQSTLTASITPSSTTIQLASTTGLPGSTPFTLSLDYGSANEELVDVTAVAALSLTVTRAVDGTSATSHNAGAVVRHVSSGRDFAESRAHEASTANVHGVVGVGNNLVGTLSTQTLSNKTLSRATGSLQNVDIFNVGTFRTTVIGDSTNPAQHRLAILENEVSLRTMAFFGPNGAINGINLPADTDATYRLRLTASDSTTDRFAVLAGGTTVITPSAATTFVPLDIVAPDTNTAKRTIRVAASGGGTERFTVWNDGHVDIVGNTASVSQLDVVAAAAQSTDIMRIQDSAAATQVAVQSTGRLLANKGATLAQPGITSGAVVQVGGTNAGYVGNLEQWVGPGNAIVAQINEVGNFLTTGNASVTGNLAVTGIGAVRGSRKTADQTVTNSTTQTNDTHLFVVVEANAVYTIDGYFVYNALAAADINLGFTVPAGSTGTWTGWGIGLAQTTASTDGYTLRAEPNNITQVRGFGGVETTGVAQDVSFTMRGLLTTAGTSGFLRAQWAQRAANAQGTILRTDSWIQIQRIA